MFLLHDNILHNACALYLCLRNNKTSRKRPSQSWNCSAYSFSVSGCCESLGDLVFVCSDREPIEWFFSLSPMLWEETHTVWVCTHLLITQLLFAVLCFSLTPSFVLCNTRPLLGFQAVEGEHDYPGQVHTANRCKAGTGSPSRSSRWSRRFSPWCLPENLLPGVTGEPILSAGVRASVTHYSLLSMYCWLYNKARKAFSFPTISVITKLWFHGCRFVRVVLNKYLKNDSIVMWLWPTSFSCLHSSSCFYFCGNNQGAFWNMMISSANLYFNTLITIQFLGKQKESFWIIS